MVTQRLIHPLSFGPSWRGELPVQRAYENLYLTCLTAWKHTLINADAIDSRKMLTVSLPSLSSEK